MAAAVAYSGSSPGGGAGIFERMVRPLIDRADAALNGRISQYLGSTSLATPKRASPFGDWQNVTAVIGSKPIQPQASFLGVAAFTVEAARKRLHELVSGAFKPETLSQTLEYLKGKEVDLVTKGATNHLRDRRTGQSCPAAQVHERLSYSATLNAEINDKLVTILGRRANVHPTERFSSAQEFAMMANPLEASDLLSRHGTPRRVMAYTETVSIGGNGKDQREQGWWGLTHAIASANPDENLRIIEEAKAKGIELLLPETRPGSAARGELVPSMPILVKSRKVGRDTVLEAMPAEQVRDALDQPRVGFAMKRLVQAWGTSMRGAYLATKAKADRARPQQAIGLDRSPAAEGSNVFNLDDYRTRKESFFADFVSTGADEFGAPEEDYGNAFGGIPGEERLAPPGVRDLRVRIDADYEDPYVYDADIKETISHEIGQMPEGTYPLETGVGNRIGEVTVDGFGGVSYARTDGGPNPGTAPDDDLERDEGRSYGMR